MSVKGYAKGGAYERRICKLLSEWKGVPRSFTRERYGFSDVHVADDFPFSVECKHRKVVNIFDVFTSPTTSVLLNAIEQAKTNAKKDKRLPMFIFRQNRCVDLMVLWNREGMKLINYFNTSVPFIKFRTHPKGKLYYCFRLKTIMDNISYEEFVNLYAT